MTIDWSNVTPDLARRRVILVLGAGISRHSTNASGNRPPAWKDFLLQAKESLKNKYDVSSIEEAIEKHDYLHACEWLKKRFDQNLCNYLRNTFSNPGFEPADVHNQILELDCRVVFTLNFDDIYERHAHSVHKGSYIVKNYSDKDIEEFLRGDGRYIVKVHGNLNAASDLIFTQKEYSQARIEHSAFYQAFDAALLTYTFVFFGCGINDPDINLLLENQNFRFQRNSPHFFVTSDDFSKDLKDSLRQNRNLEVLEYEKKDANHSGLVEELYLLNQAVDAKRHLLARNLNW